MRTVLSALLSGFVFGLGLVLSGMTQPSKVIGFLDVAGAWDPSLGFVMAGAIAVYSPLYFLHQRRDGAAPLLSLLPPHRIDAPLIVGAAVFGVGWGLSGFCPGPAISALASATKGASVFVGSMLLGMYAFHLWQSERRKQIG
jgi:uncharacterized membrane protein YedE/YeeE